MDSQIKLLNRLYYEVIPTDKLLRMIENPIRAYEDEMIEGAIIDIGCGQSSTLLDYINTERMLIAVDAEQSQLNLLKKRVEAYSPAKLDNWSFRCTNFPDETLFNQELALLILSNFLHFFTLPDCIEIGKLIAEKTKNRALVYSRVHSNKHYTNNPDHPNSEDPYFKHFFSIEDLDSVFPIDKFEKIYCAEVQCEITALERKTQIRWIEELCRKAKITDRSEITKIKKEHFEDQKDSYIDAIYRRL